MNRQAIEMDNRHGILTQPAISGRLTTLYILLLCLMLTVIALPAPAPAAEPPTAVNCDVHHGACRQSVSGVDVVLDISPKPVKAMTDLTFTISVEGKQPTAPPYIDLGMPGMKMGPNRVFLKFVRKGVYEGTGIIVRCPSGKRTWQANITLPDLGEANFVFDVIY